MTHAAVIAAMLLTCPAPPADDDAKALATKLLDAGSAVFDTLDPRAIAAGYADDARLDWVERDTANGPLTVSVKEGRDQIEAFYRDMFKDWKGKSVSKNVVQYARFIAPDVLSISGEFNPNVEHEGKLAFVQERVKRGDKWLISSIRVYLFPKA